MRMAHRLLDSPNHTAVLQAATVTTARRAGPCPSASHGKEAGREGRLLQSNTHASSRAYIYDAFVCTLYLRPRLLFCAVPMPSHEHTKCYKNVIPFQPERGKKLKERTKSALEIATGSSLAGCCTRCQEQVKWCATAG